MGKIRVLHLFGDYLNAAEIWAYNLLKSLPNAEVHIAALHYLKNNFYDPSFHFTTNELDALIQYNNRLDKRKPVQIFRKLIIKALPYFLGSYQDKLMKYVKEQSIDIIHAHFGPTAWKYRKLAVKLKVPFVVSFYGYDYEYYPTLKPKYEDYYRRLFEVSSLFLCEGNNGKSLLLKRGCPAEKIRIARLGIDPIGITFRRREKQVGELNLIQVASFTEKKGHIYTLKAFLRSLDHCPNMKLTFIGGTKEAKVRREVMGFIKENQLTEKVQVFDFLPYDEIFLKLHQHQVFIHPSCYTENRDCEGGAPIVLLDAQATGLPVISTRHCDIPEEVVHEETGWLVEEGDVDGLQKAMTHFYYLDEEGLFNYSLKARYHVERQYDIRKNAARLEEVYRSLS